MAPRILIVEDEESLTLLLRYNLEAAGYAVESVARGDEAELRLREQVPDLVLLDWMLPGGPGGPRTCERLRTLAPRTRVVMLTGLDDVRDQRAALEAGAVAFLRKGVALEEIAGTLRRVLPSGRFAR